MRYGFFTTLAEPDNRRSYAQIVRDLPEQAAFCDRAGFETVWLAEHTSVRRAWGTSRLR